MERQSSNGGTRPTKRSKKVDVAQAEGVYGGDEVIRLKTLQDGSVVEVEDGPSNRGKLTTNYIINNYYQ